MKYVFLGEVREHTSGRKQTTLKKKPSSSLGPKKKYHKPDTTWNSFKKTLLLKLLSKKLLLKLLLTKVLLKLLINDKDATKTTINKIIIKTTY